MKPKRQSLKTKNSGRNLLSLHPLKPQVALKAFMGVDPDEYAKYRLREANLGLDLKPLKAGIDGVDLTKLPTDVPAELVYELLGVLESRDELVSLDQKPASRTGEIRFAVDFSERFRKLLAALRARDVQ